MHPHWVRCLLCLALLVNTCISSPQTRPACRCRPHEPCWPTAQEWDAFNSSVNGHLQSVRPVGYVCHGDAYNQTLCDSIKGVEQSPYWRISQPGALMWTNWESLPDKNEECYIHSPTSTPCQQGRIPLYAVLAETIEEVQATVRFARDWNLRLIVRNTGHDGAGKSSGPDSLQINLSRLKQITHTKNFIPQGSRGAHSLGQAVTLGAGVFIHELAESAGKQGVVAVVGTCPTVGVAGGFLQGGGMSYMAPVFGTPVDNALEFVVVTAQGEVVVANDFQNQDLFWALRGGGGGTFGIAVSSTVRTYPDVPVVSIQLDIAIPTFTPNTTDNDDHDNDSDATIWTAITDILRAFPSLNTGTNMADVIIQAKPLPNTPAIVIITAYIINSTKTLADEQYAPLLANLTAHKIPYNYTSTFSPSLSSTVAAIDFSTTGGEGLIEGSIFVSTSFFQPFDSDANPNPNPDKEPDPDTNTAAEKITNMLAEFRLLPDDIIEIMLLGGQIHRNAHLVRTAIHPTWREALLLLIVRRSLPASPSPEEIRRYRSEMTNVQMPLLRSLEGEGVMGSYLNTADPDEPNFGEAFWGENYGRLLGVKRRWDPEGLFVVRLGVGSEEWDEEKMCRV